MGVAFKGLRNLFLSNNNIDVLPRQIALLANLEILDLRNNNITGPIPFQLGDLGNLRELRISSNRFDSTIPPELSKLTLARVIDLSNNLLTGEIPTELGRLSDSVTLNLHDNRLAGRVPDILQSGQMTISGNCFRDWDFVDVSKFSNLTWRSDVECQTIYSRIPGFRQFTTTTVATGTATPSPSSTPVTLATATPSPSSTPEILSQPNTTLIAVIASTSIILLLLLLLVVVCIIRYRRDPIPTKLVNTPEALRRQGWRRKRFEDPVVAFPEDFVRKDGGEIGVEMNVLKPVARFGGTSAVSVRVDGDCLLLGSIDGVVSQTPDISTSKSVPILTHESSAEIRDVFLDNRSPATIEPHPALEATENATIPVIVLTPPSSSIHTSVTHSEPQSWLPQPWTSNPPTDVSTHMGWAEEERMYFAAQHQRSMQWTLEQYVAGGIQYQQTLSQMGFAQGMISVDKVRLGDSASQGGTMQESHGDANMPLVVNQGLAEDASPGAIFVQASVASVNTLMPAREPAPPSPSSIKDDESTLKAPPALEHLHTLTYSHALATTKLTSPESLLMASREPARASSIYNDPTLVSEDRQNGAVSSSISGDFMTTDSLKPSDAHPTVSSTTTRLPSIYKDHMLFFEDRKSEPIPPYITTTETESHTQELSPSTRSLSISKHRPVEGQEAVPPPRGVTLRFLRAEEGVGGITGIARWGKEEVGKFLEGVGVGREVVEILKAQDVTGFMLLLLDDRKLVEMGIGESSQRDLVLLAVGDVKRLIQGPRVMNSDGFDDAPPEYS
ncbi:hypothetical protein HDU67_006800 [Dinochytrium kinnereticum]|nr:hypothetical protein HDU67_006800 [Dinochytrium kinnereticum]